MSRWSGLKSNAGHNGRAEQVELAPGEPRRIPRVRLRTPLQEGAATVAPTRKVGPLPWIGAALVALALIGYVVVYGASKSRTAVLVTTQTLQPGSVLSASDLRVAQLGGDSSVLAGLEPGSALSQVVGQRVVDGLPAGTPLARSALTAEASSGAQMTLAVSALRALDGALEAGDRVTVLGTFGAGSGQARTRVIARNLEVLSAGSVQGGEPSANATIGVTVALANPQAATTLALASENGKIDLVRESSPSTTAIPEASEAAGG